MGERTRNITINLGQYKAKSTTAKSTKYKLSKTKILEQKNKPKQLNYPGLVAFYNIRPGNGVGLFSKKKEKYIRKNKQEKRKQSYKKQNGASD